MAVKDFRELIAWQRAMELVEQVYRATTCFPKEEQYGLTSQLRRAAVSIPSNIAEGQGRSTTRDFLNFLAIAKGSLNELETQILLSERLGYVDSSSQLSLLHLIAEVRRIISGLSSSLRQKS